MRCQNAMVFGRAAVLDHRSRQRAGVESSHDVEMMRRDGVVDRGMAEAWPPERIAALKVRERIRALVVDRLDAVSPHKEALRRAFSILAQPQNAMTAARCAWRAADRMWRLAGDTATDLNHYSKRAILAGVYAATLAVFVDDKSEGKAETHAFLDRRIEGIIRFEKTKAQLLKPRDETFSLARFLGWLRYPAN